MVVPPPLPITGAQPLLTLVGPTAVGKTVVSLQLAERVGVEIISADSRQIYKELNIGTAKPAPGELARVPHHFIDELELHERFSAGEFAMRANARIGRILQRGRIPIIVGGSTLYLHALIHGLSSVPASDPYARQTLETRLENEGSAALYAELNQIDPVLADKLDPTKTQRVIRALEVFASTGRTLSSFQEQRTPPPYQYDVKVLTMDRARLYERINRRVDHMIEAGLLDEVRNLRSKQYDASVPALRTIGYQEAFAFLDGNIDAGEMVGRIKRNTRRYAKRQLTWFRRYTAEHWIDLDRRDAMSLGRWNTVPKEAI